MQTLSSWNALKRLEIICGKIIFLTFKEMLKQFQENGWLDIIRGRFDQLSSFIHASKAGHFGIISFFH